MDIKFGGKKESERERRRRRRDINFDENPPAPKVPRRFLCARINWNQLQ